MSKRGLCKKKTMLKLINKSYRFLTGVQAKFFLCQKCHTQEEQEIRVVDVEEQRQEAEVVLPGYRNYDQGPPAELTPLGSLSSCHGGGYALCQH